MPEVFDRRDMDERISRVRALLESVAPHLSSHWVESAQELLENDEPNEALIQVAWGIATDGVQVSAETLRSIEETVGDPRDLPVEMLGWSGPPTSRAPWIELLNRVVAGETDDLRCPENDDDLMDVNWVPAAGAEGGEYRIHCRSCGAETFVLLPPHVAGR